MGSQRIEKLVAVHILDVTIPRKLWRPASHAVRRRPRYRLDRMMGAARIFASAGGSLQGLRNLVADLLPSRTAWRRRRVARVSTGEGQ